jgi:hypothetical protein
MRSGRSRRRCRRSDSRRPRALDYMRQACFPAATDRPCWLGPIDRAGAACWTIASPLRVSSVGAFARCCLRLDVVARDRPAVPNQSVGQGTTGEPVTTSQVRVPAAISSIVRPDSPASAGPGSSLEVYSPSAHTCRDAYPPGAAGPGLIPLRRSCIARSRIHTRTDRGDDRPCGFYATADQAVAWPETADACGRRLKGRTSPGVFDHPCRASSGETAVRCAHE